MSAGGPHVEVLVELDVGKTEHHDTAGARVLDRPVRNDQAAFETLLDTTAGTAMAPLVIDQPDSIAALAQAVARARGVAVTAILSLVMRRAGTCLRARPNTDARGR